MEEDQERLQSPAIEMEVFEDVLEQSIKRSSSSRNQSTLRIARNIRKFTTLLKVTASVCIAVIMILIISIIGSSISSQKTKVPETESMASSVLYYPTGGPQGQANIDEQHAENTDTTDRALGKILNKNSGDEIILKTTTLSPTTFKISTAVMSELFPTSLSQNLTQISSPSQNLTQISTPSIPWTTYGDTKEVNSKTPRKYISNAENTTQVPTTASTSMSQATSKISPKSANASMPTSQKSFTQSNNDIMPTSEKSSTKSTSVSLLTSQKSSTKSPNVFSISKIQISENSSVESSTSWEFAKAGSTTIGINLITTPTSNTITTSVDTSITSSIKDYRCISRDGHKCVLPFIYDNELYDSCGKNGFSSTWCATKVTRHGIMQNWGYCRPGWNCHD